MGKVEIVRQPEAMDWNAKPDSSPLHLAGRTREADTVAIEFSRGEITGSVAYEMERLYGNLYSSLPQLRIGTDLTGTNTYVARRGSAAVAILIFRVAGARADVLNEVIKLDTEELCRFVTFVFSTFKAVGVVSFRALQLDFDSLPFPYQRFNYLEDIVVSLPDSIDKYAASLGKSTRRNTRRYLKALRDDHPSFEFSIVEKGAVKQADLLEIVELNRARMQVKSKLSRIDQAEIDRLTLLSKECGLVGIAKIDGRICAGAISSRVGDNYFLSVLAHDPAYNAYGLGMLCCYLTICACIERGGREFHFLWGQYDYKFQFLGVQRNLDNLAVYRSRIHFLWNSDFALQLIFNGYLRKAKMWLHGGTYMSNFASRVWGYVRAVSQAREKQNVYRYQVDRAGKRH